MELLGSKPSSVLDANTRTWVEKQMQESCSPLQDATTLKHQACFQSKGIKTE